MMGRIEVDQRNGEWCGWVKRNKCEWKNIVRSLALEADELDLWAKLWESEIAKS